MQNDESKPFRIVLLEDDPMQAEYVAEKIIWNHSPKIEISYFDSEYSFDEAFNSTLRQRQPDLFILDMIVRYYSPDDLSEMDASPEVTDAPSPLKAGIRIAKRLRQTKEFADTPIVIWTVLDDPRPSDDGILSDVQYLRKGDKTTPDRLIGIIRSIAAAFHRPITVRAPVKSNLRKRAKPSVQEEVSSIKLFYSYSHKDEQLRDQLQTHLVVLKRKGVIDEWHDRRISAGREWEGHIHSELDTAQIILLLVSADFLASDYCYDVEVNRAMARHRDGSARVIPVILRACDWHEAPFGKLQAVPKDGEPATSWENIDEAFADAARRISAAAIELRAAHEAS